jgi:cysteine synthase A
MICDDLSHAIGRTPLLRLARYAPAAADNGVELLAKLECLNPYSVKDRPVRAMISAALADGRLPAGGTVVEATSGNTGMATASICAARGLRATLVMSAIQSVERRQVLAALGAEVVLTPTELGTKGAKQRAQAIAAETGAFYLGQHDNPDNPAAHEATTGPELWEQTEGRIDLLVDGLGTGGTLIGSARFLKAQKPSFQTVGIEPRRSPFISEGIFAPHRLMGTAPGFMPKIIERERHLIDRIELVDEEEAFAECRRIARTEGLLVGITGGASALVASRLAQDPANAGKCIVCVFPDTGQRYLSVEGLFNTQA